MSTLQIDMMSLADSLEQVKFESGDVLFSAGTSMEDMYIIIKGELTVVLNGMPVSASCHRRHPATAAC